MGYISSQMMSHKISDHKTYDKPNKYVGMVTIEHLNQGLPYYIGSRVFGYEGEHVPVKNSVSHHA